MCTINLNHAPYIDSELLELLSEGQETLVQAARYALEGPAKRIRPILTILTAEALGASLAQARAPALAVELVHTYSLIHDDLPSMDDDDFRRGKPSLHRAFSEGIAILTGDFLLTLSFEVLAKDPLLSSEQKIKLIEELSRASGGGGMISGQILDIQAAGKSLELEALQKIHRLKTGALISSAIISGGIVGQANQKDLQALRVFAHEIGIAFQIIDDVLDVTASQEKKGSKTSSDVKNNKTTYAGLFGLQLATEKAYKHLEKGLSALHTTSLNTAPLTELSHYIVNRTT